MAGRDRVPTTQSLRRGRAGRCLLQPIARARQSVATADSRSNSNRLSAICYRPFHGPYATRFFFGVFRLSLRAAVRSITLVDGAALAGALIFWPLAFASITFLTSSA